MSEQQSGQIHVLASKLVEFQRHFAKMPTGDRQWAIQNTEVAISLFADAVKNRGGRTEEKLLERLSTTIVSAVLQFTAGEKFRPGETVDGIRVDWLSDNFKKHLLPKTESGEVAAEELVVNKLLKGSRDPAIITALGGEEKVEVSLGQFWEFLKTADRKLWYVAYVRDTDGVLWAVGADWDGDGLDVEAYSLDGPSEWNADGRFLSR